MLQQASNSLLCFTVFLVFLGFDENFCWDQELQQQPTSVSRPEKRFPDGQQQQTIPFMVWSLGFKGLGSREPLDAFRFRHHNPVTWHSLGIPWNVVGANCA